MDHDHGVTDCAAVPMYLYGRPGEPDRDAVAVGRFQGAVRAGCRQCAARWMGEVACDAVLTCHLMATGLMLLSRVMGEVLGDEYSTMRMAAKALLELVTEEMARDCVALLGVMNLQVAHKLIEGLSVAEREEALYRVSLAGSRLIMGLRQL